MECRTKYWLLFWILIFFNTMRLITFLFIFSTIQLFSQDSVKSDADVLSLGLATYTYSYDSKLQNGSIALGPSLFMNIKRLDIQLSFIVDVKKYKTYSSGHFNNSIQKNLNLFLPLLFHYNYFISKKINCFATAGIMIGGPYYLIEDNITRETNGFNFVAGTGFSIKILEQLYGRLSATARYSDKLFFPGLLFDLTIPIKITSNKNE